MLVLLQFVVAHLSVRSSAVSGLVKSGPTLIVRNGQMLRDAMRREPVADTEVEQAARLNGAARIDQIEAMILETDGSFSVVPTVPQEHRFIDTGKSSGESSERANA